MTSTPPNGTVKAAGPPGLCASCLERRASTEGGYCAECAQFREWLEWLRRAEECDARRMLRTPEHDAAPSGERRVRTGFVDAAAGCPWLCAAIDLLLRVPGFVWLAALLLLVAAMTTISLLFRGR